MSLAVSSGQWLPATNALRTDAYSLQPGLVVRSSFRHPSAATPNANASSASASDAAAEAMTISGP